MASLCRDCGRLDDITWTGSRCRSCRSVHVVSHPELRSLSILHLDADSFYASCEKATRPGLAAKPVIVGGGHRGVVAACCYVARLHGVRSAMPSWKALELCPDAVVIPPDHAKYKAFSRRVFDLLHEATDIIEPLSLDEAYLDLSDSQARHSQPAAQVAVRLAQRIEREIGITISVGLGPNKLLAKIASDQDKPRGFFVLGRQDAPEFLAEKPVTILWGVGPAMARELAALGILTVGHLNGRSESELKAHFGAFGIRLAKFARGEDDRRVTRDETAKSISAEETLDHDSNTLEVLERELWRLSQKVARKLLRDGLAAGAVSLKLKSADFQLRMRVRSLSRPTRLPEFLYEAAHALLDTEMDGTRYRLIGVGAERLQSEKNADMPDLVDLSRIEAEPDAR